MMLQDHLSIIATTPRFCTKASFTVCRKELPDFALAAELTKILFSPQDAVEPLSSSKFNDRSY